MQHQVLVSPSRLNVQQKIFTSKNVLISPHRFPSRKISQGIIEDFIVRSNYISKQNHGSMTDRVNSLQKSQKSVSKDKIRPQSKQLRIPTENFFHLTKGINLLLTQKHSTPQQQNSQQTKVFQQTSLTRRNSVEELICGPSYTGIGKSSSQDKIIKQEIQIIIHFNNDQSSNYKFCCTMTTDKIINSLKQNCEGNIVGFSTIDDNIQLDYYLQQDNLSMEHFINKVIRLKPIYGITTKKINLNCFQFIQAIGKGGFSTVVLSRSLIDGKFIALKLISKSFISQHQKQDLVQNERDILIQTTKSGAIFTNKIEYAFETKNWIVFGIEYCPGGEMFNFIKKIHKLSEQQAKFYITEAIISIGFLHNEQIIYRDIKPENILIDQTGHIQLADFGLARPNMNKETCAYSFCGSPEYMAPEMFQSSGHTQLVDYYCLGCLLYELVTGLPPFYAEDKNVIYARLLKEQVTFPEYLSSEIKDLIKLLLIKDPNRRLGSRNGIEEILSHKWFKDIDIQAFINKKVKPPYIPDLLKLPLRYMNQNEKLFFDSLQREQKTIVQQQQFSQMFPSSFYYSKDQDHNNNNKDIKPIHITNIDRILKRKLQTTTKQTISNIQLQTNFENLLKQTLSLSKTKSDSKSKQKLQF